MCGIAYGSRAFLEETFTVQSDRGMDGVGLIDKTRNIVRCFLDTDLTTFDFEKDVEGTLEAWRWHFNNNKDEEKKFTTKEDFYTYFMEHKIAFDWLIGDKFIAHHRKGSVGSKDMTNVHPYKGEKFSLMQNWTDHTFHNWGMLEGFDDLRSDSFMLLMFLEKHADTLEECAEVLKRIEDKVKYWTLVLTDKHGNALLYSDGERAMSVQIEWDQLIWFRSKRSFSEPEETTTGFIIFTIDWLILKNELKEINVKKAAARGSVIYGSQMKESDYERYYRHYGESDSLFGLSKKEEKKKKEKVDKPQVSVFYSDKRLKRTEEVADRFFWQNQWVEDLVESLDAQRINMDSWTGLQEFNYVEDYARFRNIADSTCRLVTKEWIDAWLWKWQIEEITNGIQDYVSYYHYDFTTVH